MRWLLFVCLLPAFNLTAQTRQFSGEIQKSYSLGFRINANDIFMQFSQFTQKQNVVHESGVGFGLIRTVFQQRLFPGLYYRFNYNLLNRKNWAFGTSMAYMLSGFEENRKKHTLNYFQELMPGLFLESGKKLKLRMQIETGLLVKSINPARGKGFEHHKTLAYSAQLSFRYVL